MWNNLLSKNHVKSELNSSNRKADLTEGDKDKEFQMI